MKTFIDNTRNEFKQRFDKAISYGDMTDCALAALEEKMRDFITDEFGKLGLNDLKIIIPILRKKECAELIKHINKLINKDEINGARTAFMELSKIHEDKNELVSVTNRIEARAAEILSAHDKGKTAGVMNTSPDSLS